MIAYQVDVKVANLEQALVLKENCVGAQIAVDRPKRVHVVQSGEDLIAPSGPA